MVNTSDSTTDNIPKTPTRGGDVLKVTTTSHSHSNTTNDDSSTPTPTQQRLYESSPFSKAGSEKSSNTTTNNLPNSTPSNTIICEENYTPSSSMNEQHQQQHSTTTTVSSSLRYYYDSATPPIRKRGILQHELLDSYYRERIFKDEIHGQINFPSSICKQVIDTESFQRLRDLKQLGSCYYVFPGASHNRFEHCLGVGHLAKKWIDKFYNHHSRYHDDQFINGENAPTQKDVYILQVAGLCHDLGHGPFSHVFDNEFIPRVTRDLGLEENWTHEMGSKTMFEYMLNEFTNDEKVMNHHAVVPPTGLEAIDSLEDPNIIGQSISTNINNTNNSKYIYIFIYYYNNLINHNLFNNNFIIIIIYIDNNFTEISVNDEFDGFDILNFDKNDCEMVYNMIDGHIPKTEIQQSRQYLYQIVANKKNSVDVDKFDYLARDCQNLGLISSYDSSRLMEYSRIIDGNICFSSKEVYNLYEMFHTRYNLHKQVYTHRVGKSVEYMITDALVQANSFLKISEMIHKPEEYVHLSDSILYRIETSTNPELEKSRQILKRLKRRDLYKFVDEILLPNDRFDEIGKVKEIDISTCSENGQLVPEDIIIHNMAINYSLKDKNPVDQCLFYKQGFEKARKPFYIDKNQVSYLIPSQFIERYVRVFVRDPKKLDIAYKAFQNWIKRNRLPRLDDY